MPASMMKTVMGRDEEMQIQEMQPQAMPNGM